MSQSPNPPPAPPPVDSGRYTGKPIRWYDRGDHYELWFLSEFGGPDGFGDPDHGNNTLWGELMEDLHAGNKHKELHLFLCSPGGYLLTLQMLLQELLQYDHRVAICLGECDSAGFLLFFSCQERYASKWSSFMCHGAMGFNIGKYAEQQNFLDHCKEIFAELMKGIDLRKVLTRKELKLADTSEVWLSGAKLISRGVVKNYDPEYRQRQPPKPSLDWVVMNGHYYHAENGWYREYRATPHRVRYYALIGSETRSDKGGNSTSKEYEAEMRMKKDVRKIK